MAGSCASGPCGVSGCPRTPPPVSCRAASGSSRVSRRTDPGTGTQRPGSIGALTLARRDLLSCPYISGSRTRGCRCQPGREIRRGRRVGSRGGIPVVPRLAGRGRGESTFGRARDPIVGLASVVDAGGSGADGRSAVRAPSGTATARPAGVGSGRDGAAEGAWPGAFRGGSLARPSGPGAGTPSRTTWGSRRR